jgi:hypothetical protein
MSDELNGDQINRLDNVMTLASHLHGPFGDLSLYLEAVPVSFLTICGLPWVVLNLC